MAIWAGVLAGFAATASAQTNAPTMRLISVTNSAPLLGWLPPTNSIVQVEARPDLGTSVWARVANASLALTSAAGESRATDLRALPGTQYYRLRSSGSGRFGAFASLGNRPDMPGYLTELGASWTRLNYPLDGSPLTNALPFLEAGFNLVLTFNWREAGGVLTTYGTPGEWPNAGFPFLNRATYQQRVRDALTPLLPYLVLGHQVWVQCENEIGDASLAADGRYWRGTTADYLSQLGAFAEAARGLSTNFVIVLTSFASENLDTVLAPADPKYAFQTNRMITLLAQGDYDAADVHFYGGTVDIPAKAAWVTARLPAGRRWCSTENGGPDPRYSGTPVSWTNNLALFEQVQSQQVAARLDAVSTNGAAVALWFSLFDLQGESDAFNHLGLLEGSVSPPRKRAAFGAFQSYASTNR